jgi:hypothetical protein
MKTFTIWCVICLFTGILWGIAINVCAAWWIRKRPLRGSHESQFSNHIRTGVPRR